MSRWLKLRRSPTINVQNIPTPIMYVRDDGGGGGGGGGGLSGSAAITDEFYNPLMDEDGNVLTYDP